MNRAQANKWLADQGFPTLEVDKAEGVWYMIGGREDDRINQQVDRCLHTVRLSDLTEGLLSWKLEELKDK